MNELQQELLKLFKVFDKQASDAQCDYMALSGTALGAERHQGFIPWDDDIDVGMKYTDFLRFEKYVNEQKSNYEIISYTSNKENHFFFFKFVDNNIEVITNDGETQKLWIDIFIVLPSKKRKQGKFSKWYLNTIATLTDRKTKIRHVFKNKSESLIKRTCKFFYYLAFHWVPSYYLVKRQYKKQFTSKTKGVVEYFYTPHFIPIGDFYPLTTGKFEDMTIKMPGNVHKYLEVLYGDWRKIPEGVNRITHDIELKKK